MWRQLARAVPPRCGARKPLSTTPIPVAHGMRWVSGGGSGGAGSSPGRGVDAPARRVADTASYGTQAYDAAWLRDLLAKNAQWAAETEKEEPELFPTLAKGQSPKILWLGCSDSRVPETTILGLQPGDVFTHRNIANVITPTDLSSVSVIEYAVKYLKVQHVILCGHTSCGGIVGALSNQSLGKIDTWLEPIREIRLKNLKALDGASDSAARTQILVEANVRRGVQVLRENPEIIDAMQSRKLDITGLVYDIATGRLKPVSDEADAPSEAAIREVFDLTK